jgi:hypothetical protein
MLPTLAECAPVSADGFFQQSRLGRDTTSTPLLDKEIGSMRSLGTRCLVVSLALVAATSACKKEGEMGGAGGGGAAGVAGDDLNVIPAESEVVAGINLASLRESAIFKELGQKALAQATSELSKFKAKCGFDPVDTIKSLTIGIKMLEGEKVRGSVIAHTSAPRDKLKACLEKSKADAEADGDTLKIEGDIAYLNSKKGTEFMALTFFGSDGVVALLNDSEWTKDKVTAALAGGGSIKSNKAFTEPFGAIKKGQTLWFYVNGESKAAAMAKASGLAATAFFGSVNLTDGLASDLRARMKTPAEATAAVEAFKGQMTQAQMFFTKSEMKADGNDLRVIVELTGSQLKGMAAMVGGMIGGRMGGGGMPAGGDAEAPPAPAPGQ